MSDLLKPPNLSRNPIEAINALRDYIWDVYQSVDAALDNAANQLSVTSPLELDPATLELAIGQIGASVGNGLIWNGQAWVAGGNQWFSVRSTNPQVSTGTFATVATWSTPDIIDEATYSFDKTTGFLTFISAGEYMISAAVSAVSTLNPCQLELVGQKYTASTLSWADYSGAEGYGFSLDGTQDTQQAIIPEIGISVAAGDKFRLQMRDEGQATSILSSVLTAKRRY